MQTNWTSRTEPPALQPDETHVWAVPLVVEGPQWQEFLVRLSTDERRRADEFRFEGPRRRFVVSRAALRMLLGKYLDERADAISFKFGPSGKPQLTGGHAASKLSFNLSHSGDLALIVVALGVEAGVDVELLRAVSHLEPIAKRYFHADEVKEVLSAEQDAREAAFFRCWTAKEAVLKAIGSGITGRLDTFRVPTIEHEPCWIDLEGAKVPNVKCCWLQQLSPCENYTAAVATVDLQRHIRCFTFSS